MMQQHYLKMQIGYKGKAMYKSLISNTNFAKDRYFPLQNSLPYLILTICGS